MSPDEPLTIVELRVGSHLYGTATTESDLDLKAVYLPPAREILLQRIRPSIVTTPDRVPGARSGPGELEHEAYALHRFLQLAADGQTIALEMLFAPDAALTRPPDPLWREIQALRPAILSRRATRFVSYCRQQAEKYGAKGRRIAAAAEVLAVLQAGEAQHGPTARVELLAGAIEPLAARPHLGLVDQTMPGGRVVRHLEVCGKRIPYTVALKAGREIVETILGDYGRRALDAADRDGIDWKARAHAVRVAREAVELLETGRITLPVPDPGHLLAIRRGELSDEAVAEEIDALALRVEAAAAGSALPEAPDRAALDALVERAYRARVLARGPAAVTAVGMPGPPGLAAALAEIERQEGVRILAAVESGSRAWGFPSPDSDWDVRFVYVRPLADYLAVRPPRDVIDRLGLSDALDLAGWDLRKALALATKSNAALLEWLVSPIRYRWDAPDAEALAGFVAAAADLDALAYHYHRLALGALEQLAAEQPRLKTWCYGLRPALALRWLRTRHAAPPMDVPSLVAGLALAPDLGAEITRLIATKADASEAETGGPFPAIRAFVEAAVAVPAPRATPASSRPPTRCSDGLSWARRVHTRPKLT